MTVFLSTHRYHWVLASITLTGLVALLSLPMTAQSGKAFIVQTNSAGDSVSLIDPVTDRIAFEIPDAEVIHGAAAAPDGSHLYLSNESLQTVDVVDTRTNRVVWRGWAQDSIDGMIDNQELLRKEVNKAVTRMMELFPRHL